MSEQKNENIYEEARRVVAELNEALYKDVKNASDSPEREFMYTEGSYACGITFGEIALWDSENDDRIYDEDKDELEPLSLCIKGKVISLANTLKTIAKGIKK